VEKSQEHNTISRKYKNQGPVFIIEDIADDLERHHLRPVSRPLDECSRCKERFSYKNDVDAASHLVSEHFEPDRVPKSSEVKLWIKQYHPLCDKRRSEEHLKILNRCCNHLSMIYDEIEVIRDGVRTVDTTHNQRYRLPKALVEAFRMLVILLIYTSHVMDMITEHSESWTSMEWRLKDDRDVFDEVTDLQAAAYMIKETVDQGRLDLMVMIRTQDYTDSVKRHEAVGPHYVLAMVLRNLQRGVDCDDLIDVYKEYVVRLSFQVSQFPRRRLLRDLKNVNEEIESILSSMSAQHNLFIDYLKVLDPQSFRTTTEARISQYDLEQTLIGQGIDNYFQTQAEYRQLMEHVQRLMESTKQSVEINDDDHGKAILVFTIVTLIFLPLSFVTSFLGMNTIDIRNQDSTQSLFWEVALPITAVVVIMALVIGYRYDAIREWAENNLGKRKRD
jgi:Mg2+ and Co2+ transporter CorA